MPVGESDKGFGAEKGTFYYGLQGHFTYIDWWHDPVKGEPFDHSGSLNTFIVRPSFVYGVSEKLNLVLNTTLGMRHMNWKEKNSSIHHRTESSLSHFDNANGGILGDSKILLRYLFRNTGMGNGLRIYSGGGLTIPSKNQLTSDPFFLKGEEVKDHRHFSLSNGTYNYNIESQIYYKQNINPTFYGGFFTLEKPIRESKYGYLPPTNITLVLSMIYRRFDNIDSSIGYGLNIFHSGRGYWDKYEVPNTESTSISPSISFLFGTRFGSIAINLQKPIFIDGSFSSNEGEIGQGSSIWQISASLRGIVK